MPRETLWLAPQDRIKVLASIGALVGALALILAFIAVFAAFTYPTDATAGPLSRVYMGTTDQFEVGKPVEYPAGDFYLVKQPDGSLVALYTRDPRHFGCSVRWQPDLVS